MPSGPEFPPEPISLTFRVVVIACCVSAVSIMVALLLFSPTAPSDLRVRILIPVVISSLFLIIAFEAISYRPPSLDSNGINLERPIRLGNGLRTRRIMFSHVVNVEPKVLDGYNGLLISLTDGTQTFLAQSAFGSHGLGAMTVLCNRFGRSYHDEIRKLLLEGRDGQRFRVVRIRGAGKGYWLFDRRIPTYSGPAIRKVSAHEIESVERVSTPYTGIALLLTLKDGTRFLASERDASFAGLTPGIGSET